MRVRIFEEEGEGGVVFRFRYHKLRGENERAEFAGHGGSTNKHLRHPGPVVGYRKSRKTLRIHHQVDRRTTRQSLVLVAEEVLLNGEHRCRAQVNCPGVVKGPATQLVHFDPWKAEVPVERRKTDLEWYRYVPKELRR